MRRSHPERRTLYVGPNASGDADDARSLEEAVQRLISDNYGTIVVYAAEGRDDLGLIEYLQRTWPSFLAELTIRFVPPVAQPERADEARPRPGITTASELPANRPRHPDDRAERPRMRARRRVGPPGVSDAIHG